MRLALHYDQNQADITRMKNNRLIAFRNRDAKFSIKYNQIEF